MKLYTMTSEEVTKAFATDTTSGLSSEQVKERLKTYGPNKLPQAKLASLFSIFINQFKDPLIYFLLIAALLIIILGNYTDAIVTLIVVFFNASIGTFYERNAQRTLEQLKSLVTVSALVMRGGNRTVVQAEELVPGDLIIIQEGDQIPADARLIRSYDLRVNESILTGESVSVEKTAQPLEGEKSLFDQTNLLFRGTTTTSGSAEAIVIATGAATEIGKIQQAAQQYHNDTPLQRELHRLSRSIVLLGTLLCGSLLVIGLLTGKTLSELLALVIALFIGIVPEGLPIVFTLALVTGARRLARKNVLVKRLQTTEALGRVDVIVIDKTGTLTRNEMIVRSVYSDDMLYDITGEGYFPRGEALRDNKPIRVGDHPGLIQLAEAALLMDSSEKKYNETTKSFNIRGEPTEAALGIFAHKLNVSRQQYNKLYETPFNFALRLRLGFFKRNSTYILIISGAPETVFSACSFVPEGARAALETFLKKGLRTVALASCETETPPDSTDWLAAYAKQEGNFTFLGIIGIEDALRPDARHAVEQARQAGVQVIMATGDHKTTAQDIAQKTGILMAGDLSVSGQDFPGTFEEQLPLMNLEKIKVFARVTPQDKLALINLLRKQGRIVGMTGDGVNDVPSLAAADIGIAMGLAGTDVAKEAADMVLLDDSFSSIVKALEQGRHIFATLRRVVWYFFSTNLSEVAVVVYAFTLNLPLPLRAAQILWLNVVTDGFLDVALSQEPEEAGLLSRQWKRSRQRLFDLSLLSKIALDALVMTTGTLFIFHRWLILEPAAAQTMVLVCLAMFQWFNAWNCRSERLSILQKGLLANPWLIVATGLVLALQVAVVYAPPLQILFKTVPLTIEQWAETLLVSSSIVAVEEIRKMLVRLFGYAQQKMRSQEIVL